MTLEEPRPETPEEHDRRKAAALDFDPGCEVTGCEQRGSQGARCRSCNSVRLILCGAHAGRMERRMREYPRYTLCGECGAEGKGFRLLEFRPLSRWFD